MGLTSQSVYFTLSVLPTHKAENIFCENTDELLLCVNIGADLAISLWSSSLCC